MCSAARLCGPLQLYPEPPLTAYTQYPGRLKRTMGDLRALASPHCLFQEASTSTDHRLQSRSGNRVLVKEHGYEEAVRCRWSPEARILQRRAQGRRRRVLDPPRRPSPIGGGMRALTRCAASCVHVLLTAPSLLPVEETPPLRLSDD